MQTKRSAKVLGQPNSQITKPTVHRDLGKVGCHLLEPETFSPKSLPLVSEREPEFSAALIAAAVTSTNSLPQCLESVRLDRLVSQCLDMTLPEAAFLAKLPGVSARRPQRTPEGFYGSLHQAISECGLWSLFTVAAHAEWHRSIVPAAYNERTGEIYPTEMAEWRADFRAMAPECQMVAATIVWLYRAGSDSIWLRRVSSAWRAVEALRYMRDADVLDLWLNLIVNYTGW
jgi:hypothetical protein